MVAVEAMALILAEFEEESLLAFVVSVALGVEPQGLALAV